MLALLVLVVGHIAHVQKTKTFEYKNDYDGNTQRSLNQLPHHSMALVKKTRLALFEKRPYKMGNELTGFYTGISYKGFAKDNTVIKFSSDKDIAVHDLGEYDDAVALDVTLYGKEFQGTTKWSTLRPDVAQGQ